MTVGVAQRKVRRIRNAADRWAKVEILAYLNGSLCHWCREEMIMEPMSFPRAQPGTLMDKGGPLWRAALRRWQDTVSVEHIVPLRDGGSNRIENLALCHNRCNR